MSKEFKQWCLSFIQVDRCLIRYHEYDGYWVAWDKDELGKIYYRNTKTWM
jgi:hypothetical protein